MNSTFVFYSKLKILYRDKITCPFAILSLIETIRDSREDLEEANTAKPPKQWVRSKSVQHCVWGCVCVGLCVGGAVCLVLCVCGAVCVGLCV